jgi:hypothetical protein
MLGFHGCLLVLVCYSKLLLLSAPFVLFLTLDGGGRALMVIHLLVHHRSFKNYMDVVTVSIIHMQQCMGQTANS